MHITHVEATITNALRSRAEMFTSAAAEARRGAAQPEKPRTTDPSYPMTIDMTPTPGGFAEIARMFELQAKEASELADMIEEDGLAGVMRKVNV